MSKKLFLICPFSFMESFLQSRYGHSNFFLSAPGAVFDHTEIDFLAALKDLFVQEEIKTIYIVSDTSCRFNNGVINREKPFGLSSEKIIEELFIEHYFSDFKDQPIFSQQRNLATLNVRNQISEILNASIIGPYILENNIELKGLITSKIKNIIHKTQINKHCNRSQT